MLVQIPGTFIGQLRLVQLRHRFQIGPFRHTEICAVEQGQQRVFLHILPDIHIDFHDPPTN